MACETQQSFGASPNFILRPEISLEGGVSHAILRSIILLGIFSAVTLATARGQNQGAPAPAPSAAGAAAPSSAAAAPAPVAANAPAADPSPAAEAEELFRAEKYDDAATAYRAIIASGPDPAAGYAGLARVYLRQHKFADALSVANEAVATSPKSPDAHVALGEVLYRQGKIDQAENEFLTVINSGAKNSQAFLDLARAEMAASYNLRAKMMINMAHRMDPNNPAVKNTWLSTLPLNEKIKQLDADLAGGGLSNEERAAAEMRLEAYKNAKKHELGECRIVNSVTSTQMTLEPMMGHTTDRVGFGLKVKMNGASALLLVDTGAGGITVNSKTAEKAGIKRWINTQISGIGDQGSMSGYIGIADSLKIGELEFQNCAVHVTEGKSRLNDDGLIGTDVFSQFLVDLDLPDSKMRLSELPKNPQQVSGPLALDVGANGTSEWHDPYVAPEMKTFTRVYRVNHYLLIPTRLNGTLPRLFLVDTGGFDNTISTEAAAEITKVQLDSDTTVKGLSGKVNKVYTANNVTIDFAHFRQERHDLIAFDGAQLSDSAGVEVSGMLGFQMLQLLEIRIDYRDGLIEFKYNPNRFM
jgi:tetratricopeptide (TPR) repeat protein